MRRMLGFVFFWMAVGMIITLFVNAMFIEILIIIILLLLGYNLFCCG